MQEEAPVVLGPFRLDSPIGEGGMGAVYRGRHRRDGRPVAVKVMTSELARREERRSEFRREVQALAKLHHPSVARVVDYGVVDEPGSEQMPEGFVEDAPWFAMEFVEGESAEQCAKTWEWERIERFLLQLLDALAHAHANEVVHRDLKPDNILITDASPGTLELKLVDFGIAHVFDAGDQTGVERAPATWGTPEVMAPEQIRGAWRDQGPWTDLYALGCIAWWMVCHEPPFIGSDRSETYLQHVSGATGPFEPALEVPDGFEEWLRQMLATDRTERFQRAADAAYALLRRSQSSGGFDSSGEPRAPLRSRESARGRDDFFECTVPPIPNDWERAEPSYDRPAPDAGLSLFDLRKIPLVDRRRERDELWRALRAVWRTRQPVARLLRGPAGSGKSRLAEWIARRGHEVGALTVMKATHSPKGSPRDGLGPMLARQFRCANLDWSDGFDRVRDVCEALGMDRSTAYHDAVGLAGMMGLDDDDESSPPGFQNPREKHLALHRLLANVARRRPVLLWLDDVAWGWEAARFAEYLLRETMPEPLPILTVMTARDNAIEDRPQVRRMLETICGHEFGDDLPVRPLDREAHRELVGRLLHLDEDLVDEIVDRTEGHPLFAIQLVGDWVERGVLTGGSEGFELRAEPERPIPDEPHELWRRRIGQVLEPLDAADREEGLKSMELAAALGRHVDAGEWRRVCGRAGVEARDGLVETLVEYGLGRRKPNGWSFVHSMLTESLERTARDAGRWKRWHRICAEAIRRETPERSRETAGRRAAHYLEAGDRERALEPLLGAARRAGSLGRNREHRQYLDWRRDILDQLGVDAEDRRRADNWFERAAHLRDVGDHDEARRLLERTQKLAWKQDWPRVLGDLLRLESQIAWDDGAVETSLELAEAAEQSFREVDHSLGRAHCQITSAQALLMLGDYRAARDACRRAKSLFNTHGRPTDELSARMWLTYTYIYAGEYAVSRSRARDVLERARELGDKSSEADIWNQLGECARFEREWGEARRYYRRAAEEYRQIGYRGESIATMKMAMVELPAGRYERARRELRDVAGRLKEVGLRVHLPRVEAGLLAAAAGLRDWRTFDELWERVGSHCRDQPGVSKDTAWLTEQAARIAVGRGAVDRSKRLYELARNLWERLDASGRVSWIDEQLRDVG